MYSRTTSWRGGPIIPTTAITDDSICVFNPATGDRVGSVAVTPTSEVRAVVDDVRDAASRWALEPVRVRCAVLRRFHDLLLARSAEVLDTIQAETGKARRDALAEIVSVAATVRHYGVRAPRILREASHRGIVPVISQATLQHVPRGVIGVISPWNFPFLLAIGDAIAALAAGNGVVVKASEVTPLSAALARDLLVAAGLDPQLVQVVHGGGNVGEELIRHVDYVAFTGGTATGRKVAEAAAIRGIPCSLELGGKNAAIVLADANPRAAARGLAVGAFANTGQACIGIERIFVERSRYAAFVDEFVRCAAAIRVGYGTAWDIDMGSLISAEHADSVRAAIQAALERGATQLIGEAQWHHRDALAGHPSSAAFVVPTVLANVDPHQAIERRETFGPVVSLHCVESALDAVQLANDTQYGLNASIWTRNRARARAVASRLDVGTVGINCAMGIYNAMSVPMGGIGASGPGSRHGDVGLLRFTRSRSLIFSPQVGGGYDAILSAISSLPRSALLVRSLALWRRLPLVR